MNNIEKIRQKMEGLKAGYEKIISASSTMTSECLVSMGKVEVLNKVIAFIDSLPDENNPEPYNPVYDEDYLNEKIAKATKSWEGVDVDKMLADCRGYEEKPSEDLEEAAKEYMKKARKHLFDDSPIGRTDDAFIAGAEWMRKKDVEDMYMSDNRHFLKCYDQGKVDMKVEMMKDAVEGEVIYDLGGFFRIKSEAIDGAKYKVGSWVKLIIVKED